MFAYPDQCKHANKWVMRRVLTVEERLRNVPYPDPSVSLVEQPVEVIYKLPPYVYTTEDATNVKIGVWDESTGSWNTDFISGDLSFNKTTREVRFSTVKFAPMAMLQSRCTDYPYQNWWLRCIDQEKALLDIWTKRTHLIFEIGPLYLKLVENDAPELCHLVNVEHHPGYLMQELSKCGIHLMPRDEDAKLAGVQSKDRAAEERAIIDVASSVRAFHFRRSKWNQGTTEATGVPEENIVLRIRENLEFDREFLEDFEPDWRQVFWWGNKCAFYDGCKENGQTCTPALSEGQLTHAMFAQAIAPPMCTEEAHAIVQDYTYIEFIDTVKKTLRLTRLLSFS